jgi:DNA helicase-2/ATP-dependent DNA helicase PcrA
MSKQIMLSETQKSIVAALDGALYVKASAGSGKTRVLTERIRVLLSRSQIAETNRAGDTKTVKRTHKCSVINLFNISQSVFNLLPCLVGKGQSQHFFITARQ